jgi:polar amino acid transport system ATP-binding protein
MAKNKELILQVKDIHKSFGNKEVLKGISFEVYQGETKVIIGPSGMGKSTLLRCINQLTIPDKGTIWLRGQEVNHHNTGRLINFVKKLAWFFKILIYLTISMQ